MKQPPQSAQALLQRAQEGERSFSGASLWGAQLKGAALAGVDLARGDLRRANLEEADLRGADLRGADLTGADLDRARLEGADLRGASLTQATWVLARYDSATRWPEGTDHTHLDALGPGAVLHNASLRGLDLRGADLRGAQLYKAQLENADLRGADLRGTFLRGALLQGALLLDARLEGAALEGAGYDAATRWPGEPPAEAQLLALVQPQKQSFASLGEDKRPEALPGSPRVAREGIGGVYEWDLLAQPAEGLLDVIGGWFGAGREGSLWVSDERLEQRNRRGEVVAALTWEEPFAVEVSVWIPRGEEALELRVGLKQRGPGQRGEVAFRVKLPHGAVARQVALQQVRDTLWLGAEDFGRLWPLVGYFTQLQGLRLPHQVAPEPAP